MPKTTNLTAKNLCLEKALDSESNPSKNINQTKSEAYTSNARAYEEAQMQMLIAVSCIFMVLSLFPTLKIHFYKKFLTKIDKLFFELRVFFQTNPVCVVSKTSSERVPIGTTKR